MQSLAITTIYVEKTPDSFLPARPPLRSDDNVLNVSPLLRELILNSCGQSAWTKRVAHERLVIEITVDELTRAKAVPLQLLQPSDPRAQRVAAELSRDPRDSRTLSALCRTAGASKRTVERAFVLETGMSLGKWRQQLRLLHAMRRLSVGDKVLAAAPDAGYRSPSAFISAFKKSCGRPPSRFLGRGDGSSLSK